MYIIKNALRCVSRAKGRNVLIGIIALIIAVSACLGLSIRQAAENAKESTLEGMSVTGTISYDRQSMMGGFGGGSRPDFSGGFDKEAFENMMSGASSLTLEEYLVYANASTVEDFYYTLTAYFDGSENFEPVTTDSSSGSSGSSGFPGGMPGGMGGFGGMMGMGSSGDFALIGYSADIAMTEFLNSTASMVDGVVFDEGVSNYTCIISSELATYNTLAVGDTITLTNPNSTEETYTLTIVGIYQSTGSNDFSMSMFGSSQDPANRIYMSAATLQTILDASAEVSTTVTDETTGREQETAVTGDLTGTYVFANVEDFRTFEEEVYTLGLSDSYTVSSDDIIAFESSLTPLNTLSTMAGLFLLVILAIGAVILVVLNIFNVRERKYEIGVLTAMGMKKWKVATQFICEILVITMLAVAIGVGVGAVASVPVTNALLENQINSQNSMQSQIDGNMGRPGNLPGGGGGSFPGGSMPDFGGGNFMENFFGGTANFISEVDSAMDLTVVFQMLGVGLLLTLIASAASVLFVMRYDPLKILSNRD